MSASGLRIAWFSDLSIGRPESLSTYTTRMLLPELAKQHEIEIFSDQVNLSSDNCYVGLEVKHYLNAYKRHREQPFDLFFYQLEDSRACRFIRGHIGLVPGVVWVHDLFCNDLGPEACHTSPWERSIRQFFDPTLDFSDRLKAPHQLWPRAFRETSLSPVVLLSSKWALSEFRRMVSNRLESGDGMHFSGVLPIPVDLPAQGDLSRAQRPPFNIATVSVAGIEGRSHKVLPVLRELDLDWSLTWLIDPQERPAAQALVAEFGVNAERVTFIEERSAERWREVVAESDLALHLHTSPFGHLAPFLGISLAHGCPVVTARSAQGDDLPDGVVFKITPGLHESAQLRAILLELITTAEVADRRSMYGAPGLAYARECFNPERIARLLSEVLVEQAPQLSYVMDRWRTISRRADKALLSEVRGLVSAGQNDVVSAYDMVLAPALRELGWG
jgi:hypothetical protein